MPWPFPLFGAALVAPFAAVVVTVASFIVYRLWLHPIAQYPGPIMGRLTNFYSAYHSWKGDMHLDMWRCHEKYGNCVRYCPDRMIFNTTDALRDIYSFGKNVQKSKSYLTMMHRVPNTITQRNKELHAKQRRLLSHGFSDASLRTYEDSIAFHIEKFCQYLVKEESADDQVLEKPEWSSPQNMASWSDYIAFDIMLDVIYGFQSNMISKSDNRYLLEAIAVSNIRVGVLMPLWYVKNTFIDRYLFPSSIVARYTFLAWVKDLLKRKREEPVGTEMRKSVYSMLYGSKDREGLSPNEIAAESTNLVIAGSDTTSTVLAATLFYLSRNPNAYAKAASEIRTRFQSVISLPQDRSELNSCTYLRACIDEALRLAAPIGSALFREVETGGIVIDGHAIPAMVDVGTCIYSIHHNPAYYEDPFSFIPERWIMKEDRSNTNKVERAREAFTPFSIGPRSCIGKPLALMELTSILANILYRFDFRIAEGEIGHLGEGREGAEYGRHRAREFQLYDHITAAKKGPVLQFKKRDDC